MASGEKVTRVFQKIEVKCSNISKIWLKQTFDDFNIHAFRFKKLNYSLTFKLFIFKRISDTYVKICQVFDNLNFLQIKLSFISIKTTDTTDFFKPFL